MHHCAQDSNVEVNFGKDNGACELCLEVDGELSVLLNLHPTALFDTNRSKWLLVDMEGEARTMALKMTAVKRKRS